MSSFKDYPIRRPTTFAPTDSKLPRLNYDIRVSPIRVVNVEGEMLGEMETEQAMELAKDQGVDLVEVNPDASPPVCRLMDFKKERFERKKRTTGPRKRQSQLKQIRMKAKIGQHDLDVKVQKAREFLERKDKVKINVVFRGRENAHHDRGRVLLNEIIAQLKDAATVETFPQMEHGRSMFILLNPV